MCRQIDDASNVSPFVYILESKRDERYYVGSTTNVEKRLKHHQSGGTPSTRRMGPMELVFQQEFPTLQEARHIEKRLKKLKRKDYLKKIVRDGYIKEDSWAPQ